MLGDIVDGEDGITQNNTVGDCTRNKGVFIMPEPEERMKMYHKCRGTVWKWMIRAERRGNENTS